MLSCDWRKRGLLPAPFRPRWIGWRLVRDGEASDALHRRAKSACPLSRPAAARDHTRAHRKVFSTCFNSDPIRGSQSANSRRSTSGSPGADHDSFISSSAGTKPDVIDHLSGAHRKRQEVPALSRATSATPLSANLECARATARPDRRRSRKKPAATEEPQNRRSSEWMPSAATMTSAFDQRTV